MKFIELYAGNKIEYKQARQFVTMFVTKKEKRELRFEMQQNFHNTILMNIAFALIKATKCHSSRTKLSSDSL